MCCMSAGVTIEEEEDGLVSFNVEKPTHPPNYFNQHTPRQLLFRAFGCMPFFCNICLWVDAPENGAILNMENTNCILMYLDLHSKIQ